MNWLYLSAQREETMEVSVKSCIDLFGKSGASPNQIVDCLDFLYKKGLIRTTTSENPSIESSITLTKSGAHYVRLLCEKHVYVEECMFDTAIEDAKTWREIYDLTVAIDGQTSIVTRWILRKQRTKFFTDYLCKVEDECMALLNTNELACMRNIQKSALEEADEAIYKSGRRTNKD
jgi:DNA-binding PadR family transcriptional regulator